MNLKFSQDLLDRVYLDHQCDAFKINNALVYQILWKMITNTDAYVYMKQRNRTQYDQAVFIDIHKQFFRPGHVARQATETERKLQTSHYDSKRKGWDWDKYVTIHKEQHAIMESHKIMATVEWTMAPKFATFSKASKVLSWRLQL